MVIFSTLYRDETSESYARAKGSCCRNGSFFSERKGFEEARRAISEQDSFPSLARAQLVRDWEPPSMPLDLRGRGLEGSGSGPARSMTCTR